MNQTNQPKLYHKDLGYPAPVARTLPRFHNRYNLDYTTHARRAAVNSDQYPPIDLPAAVDFGKCDPIEVEVIGNRINKIVYRTRYDSDFDLCLVVLMADLLVKTVWLNRRSDKHATLDMSRYAQVSA
jgi:hypothetical protein